MYALAFEPLHLARKIAAEADRIELGEWCHAGASATRLAQPSSHRVAHGADEPRPVMTTRDVSWKPLQLQAFW